VKRCVYLAWPAHDFFSSSATASLCSKRRRGGCTSRPRAWPGGSPATSELEAPRPTCAISPSSVSLSLAAAERKSPCARGRRHAGDGESTIAAARRGFHFFSFLYTFFSFFLSAYPSTVPVPTASMAERRNGGALFCPAPLSPRCRRARAPRG
jgi:hypothetical protein